MNYKFKPSHIVPAYLFIVAVLYGGSKPPASTNTPPDSISGDSTNDVAIIEGDSTNSVPDDASSPTNQPPPVLMARRLPSVALAKDGPRLALSAPPQPTTNNQQLTTNMPWHVRGAYCDWLHITFPSSFAFPSGTNLLTGVTVMAYGTLRQTLKDPTPIAALPQEVSLEPSVSSFVCGLTPSNSFVFAWQNVCVNRNPTNRVDASIELFDSGACSVRFDTVETFYPAQPPEGFVGQGQDDDWLAANFSPTDYAAITNKGYARWLSEDYVGVNEQNGHYRADITVASLPDSGAPCYLVCGSYKVVVSHPGTYSFPLEVFEHYRARTYPVAVPLTISTDDGYSGSQFSNAPVLMASRPRLALSAPPNTPPEYDICEEPRLVISPTEIPLNQAVGTHISIWCNVASTARRYCALISREFRLNFCNPSDAEIVAAEVEDLVEIMIDAPLGTCVGTITITDLHSCCGCGSCTGSDCTCGCDCWRHSQSNDTPTNSPSATP